MMRAMARARATGSVRPRIGVTPSRSSAALMPVSIPVFGRPTKSRRGGPAEASCCRAMVGSAGHVDSTRIRDREDQAGRAPRIGIRGGNPDGQRGSCQRATGSWTWRRNSSPSTGYSVCLDAGDRPGGRGELAQLHYHFGAKRDLFKDSLPARRGAGDRSPQQGPGRGPGGHAGEPIPLGELVASFVTPFMLNGKTPEGRATMRMHASCTHEPDDISKDVLSTVDDETTLAYVGEFQWVLPPPDASDASLAARSP